MVMMTESFSYYSVFRPLCWKNTGWLLSSNSSLSPACHRRDGTATNSALRLPGWAKLAKAEEMFVYLRANGSEVWKRKHPSCHTREKCTAQGEERSGVRSRLGVEPACGRWWLQGLARLPRCTAAN